jgi:hypothetical protein
MHKDRGKNAYRILIGKPEGNRPLGSHICRSDNIKMNLTEIRWDGMDWFKLALDREQWRALVNMVMNFGFDKCWEILE